MSEFPSTGSGIPSGLRVLVAGASGASGQAVSAALRAAGAQVIAVGSNPEHLQSAYANDDGVLTFACDLADAVAVRDLAERVAAEAGSIDGLVHLVGGWRGGKGIAGQTDEDWDFLHRNLVTTLRNTTRAFYDDLAASPHGRAVIVSATAVGSPTAGGANYAAAKAAAESWMFSVADGFRRDQAAGPGANETSEAEHSAAVVLVIKALVDDRMRAGNPEKPFTGFTDVADLATAVKNLFGRPAAEINGRRIPLV
ncbi:SDR family NAD(P)-dependent oxidoreductase [Arthrobacter crystallopoietes]|uniref:NADP-dependent 3-hydroxy acid dehydrogenase YdfG n=1 Tax=Crystallibacter crystallopoietes TaxID=37928 RepID=A0A1H1GVB5_9MICC|nr:SDR family NAD(P)-dependent oxidoreductase [Arthrobacter crystallopoietes]AUI52355.1 oxidoreductase [Arthrobacter crystallopoietes]SDR16766.1 NADP-dependent 3-hydroxy acid dehydrogenase YdfG [Arthrobacter crystallopoietes]